MSLLLRILRLQFRENCQDAAIAAIFNKLPLCQSLWGPGIPSYDKYLLILLPKLPIAVEKYAVILG